MESILRFKRVANRIGDAEDGSNGGIDFYVFYGSKDINGELGVIQINGTKRTSAMTLLVLSLAATQIVGP